MKIIVGRTYRTLHEGEMKDVKIIGYWRNEPYEKSAEERVVTKGGPKPVPFPYAGRIVGNDVFVLLAKEEIE